MLFSKEDFEVDSLGDFFAFLLILPFFFFILPFLGAAYTLGFIMDITGWLET
jgi:hypothetical protein